MARRPHDPYGRPFPTLAPPSAPAPGLLHSERNTTLRGYLVRLLEEDYRDLFQHGMWADLTIHLRLVDGTLQPDLDIVVVRKHRYEKEG